jgi:hypothetical protein
VAARWWIFDTETAIRLRRPLHHYGIPAGFGSFIVTTWYAEGKYVQQCATTVTLNADANQDVTLTSLQNLASGNSLRPPPVPGTRTISGVVFEVTAAGRQPIEGATVGFEGNNDITSAWTFTDASGRYLLCGLPRRPTDWAVCGEKRLLRRWFV